MMSLQVHYMAIASERKLLPTQAERGWQIEQVEAARKRRSSVLGCRPRVLFGTALVRFGQSLHGVVATTRHANAAST